MHNIDNNSYVAENSCFKYYSLGDGIKNELHNNLILVNAIVGRMQLESIPEFQILGGAALVFYGLMDRLTMDIDIANTMDARLRSEIDVFISDQASAVVKLGKNYRSRLVPYMQQLTSIKVYLLSREDIVITKMMSNRRKDIADLLDSGILTASVIQNTMEILQNEYPEYAAGEYCKFLQRLAGRKENCVEQSKRVSIYA